MKKIPAIILLALIFPAVALHSARQYVLQSSVVLSERDILPYQLEEIDQVLLSQKRKLENLFMTNVPGKPEVRFASTLEDFMQDKTDWSIGGFYERGRITLQPMDILKKKGSLNTILAHEYSHYFLENVYPGLPFFLNEGLSFYLSGSVSDPADPVLPENMADWSGLSGPSSFEPEVFKRYLYSARNFIAYLISAKRIPDFTNLVRTGGGALSDLYHEFYDSKSAMVRVLINPRGEKHAQILFDGVCCSVESRDRNGDTNSSVRTNYYTNRVEMDSDDSSLFLNDHDTGEVRLIFENGFRIGEFSYRGNLRIVRDEGRILMINILPCEYYLYGVVASEMPSTNLEALKAQAVLSRTLARYKMVRRAGEPYDLVSLTSDQSYRGRGWESPNGISAVRNTEGLILTWQDKLVYPYYSSTCSGWTALSKDVWQDDLPYTKSVACRLNGTNLCSISPHYPSWNRKIASEELSSIMKQAGVTNIETTGTDPHGRVKTVLVNGVSFSFDEFKAKVARKKGWNFLKSNLVSVRRSDDGSGFEIKGWGLGHGVGLCQYGAVRLSRWMDYGKIIQFYFNGTAVRQYHDGMELFPKE